MYRVSARRLALVIATAFVGSAALILLVLGYRYAGQRQPSPNDLPPVAASSAPATSLELSVFDQSREMPEIRFADAEGRGLSLADFRGKVILLNVWATWCVPCRKEMPSLDRLQAQLGGDEFTVLPLSIDRAGLPAIKRFYEELGLKHLGIYVDASGGGSRALGAPGLPTTLLVDRAGREVARKVGPTEWDSPEMVALIRQQMAAQRGAETRARP